MDPIKAQLRLGNHLVVPSLVKSRQVDIASPLAYNSDVPFQGPLFWFRAICNRGDIMRRVRFRAVVLALLCLIPAYAQEIRATLSGTIIDPSGAAIVGVKVSVVNVDTSAKSQAETNQLGQYRILFLHPGKYRLTAEMSGFKTLVREGI